MKRKKNQPKHMARFERIKDELCEVNEQAVLADGFEPALIGVVARFGMAPVACYDSDICIGAPIKGGCTEEEAIEHFEFNVIGSDVANAPVFVRIVE